jgi:hypothetical protein
MRKAKITVAILAVLILGGFTWLAIYSGSTTEKLQTKTIKLQTTEAKLKDVNLQVEELKTQTSKDKEKHEEQQKLLEQKEKEKQELEAKLQAKAEAKKQLEIAAAEAKSVISAKTASAAPAPQRVVTGTKTEWMAAAGIPQEHWGYVDSIVTRESGWNPNAVNKSSGACGLGQQLPCGKWAGAWNDPVAALQAMTGYVNGRYGGWGGAVAFWNANHWY